MTLLKNSELNITVIIVMKCYDISSLNKKILGNIIIKIVLENKAFYQYILVYSILIKTNFLLFIIYLFIKEIYYDYTNYYINLK